MIDIITILLGLVIFVLLVILIVAAVYYQKTIKKLDALLENGKIKDFKDIFLSQKDKNNELEKKLKEAFLRVEHLEDVSRKTIQKTAVVRFDPFNEMGGRQSFSVAFLDNHNNGFVISSLFVKEGNRVFAKAIKDGKSETLLSAEEMQAIEKAIKG